MASPKIMLTQQLPKYILKNTILTIRKLFAEIRPNLSTYSQVTIGKVSPLLNIPDHICKPSYYLTGIPTENVREPEVKNEEQIAKMRTSCKLAANILKKSEPLLAIGQTTDNIDRFIHDEIISNGAYPSTFNYKNYPKSVCTSVNNIACHGIPDDRPLENGDIINVDITVYYDGYHGDCSKTYLIGEVDKVGKDLVTATEDCLMGAIEICKPGLPFSAIGAFIEEAANNIYGYGVIPVFAGHGIGSYFHGPPDIFHMKNRYPGVMRPGMTFTIEPILSEGSCFVEILSDKWSATTDDYSRTAQFEHTVLITPTGVDILTLPD